MDIQVYQIRLKLYCLHNIPYDFVQKSITFFIDKSFLQNEKLSTLHKERTFKNYCYDLPYPVPKDKTYHKDTIYTLTLRTIDKRLADHFANVCTNLYTNDFKGITAETRTLPPKIIEFLFTLTPVIIKTDSGYWRSTMDQMDFANRLKINMLNKYHQFTGKEIDPDFNWFSTLEFLNNTPAPMIFKHIKLLGDKLRLSIEDNPRAQLLSYLAIGTGIGEMNSRGAGFISYRWL